MTEAQWKELAALPDWALHDFVTEDDSSQRKHAALHLLAIRRNKAMERVAMWSAIAAGLAALVAAIQLLK